MNKLDGFYKGVNLGGWLSQGSLDKKHLDTFITKKDIETIVSWGCDHVRLPIDYENIENEQGYFYIDSCINWCKQYGLKIVLDLHKTYGYSFADLDNAKDFFESKSLQDKFIDIWDKLSKRYRSFTDIIMFELLNEVTRFDVADKWNEIALRAIKTIRKNAPTVKILLGGVGYSSVSAVKLLPYPTDENIVYNVHCYEPMIFTHQTAKWCKGMPNDFHISYPDSIEKYNKEIQKIASSTENAFVDANTKITKLGAEYFEELFSEAISVAKGRNVLLYCGEYGVIDKANIKDTLNWYSDIHTVFEKYNIGRAAWSYKKMNFGLSGSHYKSILDKLIKLL